MPTLEQRLEQLDMCYAALRSSKAGDDQTAWDVDVLVLSSQFITALAQLTAELRELQAQQAAFQEEVDK